MAATAAAAASLRQQGATTSRSSGGGDSWPARDAAQARWSRPCLPLQPCAQACLNRMGAFKCRSPRPARGRHQAAAFSCSDPVGGRKDTDRGRECFCSAVWCHCAAQIEENYQRRSSVSITVGVWDSFFSFQDKVIFQEFRQSTVAICRCFH